MRIYTGDETPSRRHRSIGFNGAQINNGDKVVGGDPWRLASRSSSRRVADISAAKGVVDCGARSQNSLNQSAATTPKPHCWICPILGRRRVTVKSAKLPGVRRIGTATLRSSPQSASNQSAVQSFNAGSRCVAGGGREARLAQRASDTSHVPALSRDGMTVHQSRGHLQAARQHGLAPRPPPPSLTPRSSNGRWCWIQLGNLKGCTHGTLERGELLFR